jgi:hypothetical protein
MSAKKTFWQLTIFCLTIFLMSGCGSSIETGQETGQREQRTGELQFRPQVVIRKPFPAIVKPKMVSAAEANQSVHPEELVLGVEIDGISRAYPINMLTGPQREIINDELGGQAIAATW